MAKIRTNLCYLAKEIKQIFVLTQFKMIKATNTRSQYEKYRVHMRKLADLRASLALMQWDQETYLPKKGTGFRAQQIATLAEMAHEMATTKKLGSLLESLSEAEGLDEAERKNIILNLEDFEKQKKYTAAFVRRMSECVSKSFNAWNQAKKESRFELFENELAELVSLKKEETDILGYSEHPYDALMDEYEKGCTVKFIDSLFANMLPKLRTILEKIQQKNQPEDAFLFKYFDHKKQWDLGMDIIAELGFDFEAGRQDLSSHPFSTSFNKFDVRITTRIDEHDFSSMLFSCIHETGHALYEQGLPESEYGLPSGEYASLGIHESQSRLWENHVGRSHSFWKVHYPKVCKIFPEAFTGITADAFYKAVNKVKPSLIRTESDELTYHFHVMIRYEIEKKLIVGEIKVKDIPALWNESYKYWLGVDVPDDRRGCLQDVHWSHGSFGYFPTYSLGSFYAAQFFREVNRAVPELENKMEKGDTSSLLLWLRQRIHALGRTFNSAEVCKLATGEDLNVVYFLDYVLDKYGKIYEF
jgi:carboxypeptidase Taq